MKYTRQTGTEDDFENAQACSAVCSENPLHLREEATLALTNEEDESIATRESCERAKIPLDMFFAQVLDGSKVNSVAINMSNAIIGAGIVGIPSALAAAGLGFGLFLLFTMAAITSYSIGCLVSSGIYLRSRSYEETAHRAVGPWGERAVLLSQFFFDFGASLS